VAAALSIPYEYLMMIVTAGSYNAQKGARLAFADTCRLRHKRLTVPALSRVWNWRIAKAIKDGELPPAPTLRRFDGIVVSQWYKVRWGMPRFQDIDVAKDVSARSASWAAGQSSLRDGDDDPVSTLKAKATDIIEADTIADTLNGQLKTARVNWRDIINAGVPGMTTNVTAPDAPDSPDAETTQENDNADE